MNQHAANTQAARIREALRKLGRATSTEVALESGVPKKYVSKVLPRYGRVVAIARFHHFDSGPFPYIYEPLQRSA